MGYGTKIVIRTLNTPEGPIEYWRAVPMYATSYSPCRLGVPNYCSTTMANGEELTHGNAAYIVRWYRVMRGQYVYVPGYGTAKISDTGGGIPGNLDRVIPPGLCAHVERAAWQLPHEFRMVQELGSITDDELLHTFNCGLGMILVVAVEHASAIGRVIVDQGLGGWRIGEVRRGVERVAID